MEALEVGCFMPKYHPTGVLFEGEIGYIVTGLKSLQDAKVGDTVFAGNSENKNPIQGFKTITPYIFAGMYPVETDEYPKMKDAVEKLQLNDSSLVVEHEASPALGYGFRAGFLGLLHLDIIKERLWREHTMDVIITSPQVTYKVLMPGDKTAEFTRLHSELTTFDGKTGTYVCISNPAELPKP